MALPRTLFEKIWQRHVIVQRGDNEALLHVDRNFGCGSSREAAVS